MKKDDAKKGLSTRAIHAGHDNSNDPHKPIVTPIYQTASYAFDEVEGLWSYYQKTSDRLAEYARYGTPTQRALEENLCSLEGAADCVVTSSGMNAIASAIIAVANSGENIVCLREGYRGTFKMFDQHLARLGISTHYADLSAEAIIAACREKTRAIFIEYPTNPFLRLIDLEAVTAFARKRGIVTIVDATFASPLNINPLAYSVDLVVHSLTKFLNGHNDAIAGAVLGSAELIEKVRSVRGLLGSNPDAHLCFLVSRGIKTFALRMREHNRSTLEIAQWLEQQPKIRKVWYPLLESHPDYELAKKYLRGGGGVVSFEVRGQNESQEAGLAASTALLNHLKIPAIAASLGGVESLVHQPTVMSYHDLDAGARRGLGIPDSLVRYSVGLEDTADLIGDLAQALEHI